MEIQRCSDIVPLGVPHTTMQVYCTLVHLLHLSNLYVSQSVTEAMIMEIQKCSDIVPHVVCWLICSILATCQSGGG